MFALVIGLFTNSTDRLRSIAAETESTHTHTHQTFIMRHIWTAGRPGPQTFKSVLWRSAGSATVQLDIKIQTGIKHNVIGLGNTGFYCSTVIN